MWTGEQVVGVKINKSMTKSAIIALVTFWIQRSEKETYYYYLDGCDIVRACVDVNTDMIHYIKASILS